MKKCYFCQGKVIRKKIDIIRYWGDEPVALKQVPVLVCQQCGEQYFDAAVSAKIDKKIQSVIGAQRKSVKVEILQVPSVSFS